MKSWAGKRACVVITTDDGWLPTLESLYELSIDFPFIRTTNYIVTGDESEFANNENWTSYKDNPQILEKLISKGHEIGSHTHNHLNLTTLTDEQLTSEMQNSYDALLSLGVPLPFTIGYPYGSNPDASKYHLIEPYYVLGRDTAQQNSLIFLNNSQINDDNKNSEFDAYKVSCRNAGWDYNNETEDDWLNRMKSYVNDAIDNNACVFILFHYIDEELRTGYGTIKTSMVRRFYEYLETVKDSLWIPTVKQFYKAYSNELPDAIPGEITGIQYTEITNSTNKVEWSVEDDSEFVDFVVCCDGNEIGRTYHNEFIHECNSQITHSYSVIGVNSNGRSSLLQSYEGQLMESDISLLKTKVVDNFNETNKGFIKIGNTVRYIEKIYIKKE